jgi:hypothetical protein
MNDIRKNIYENSPPIINAIDFILSQKDINICDEHGDTMLHWSCCRKDGRPLVELLLYLGIDKDRKDKRSITALSFA